MGTLRFLEGTKCTLVLLHLQNISRMQLILITFIASLLSPPSSHRLSLLDNCITTNRSPYIYDAHPITVILHTASCMNLLNISQIPLPLCSKPFHGGPCQLSKCKSPYNCLQCSSSSCFSLTSFIIPSHVLSTLVTLVYLSQPSTSSADLLQSLCIAAPSAYVSVGLIRSPLLGIYTNISEVFPDNSK